MLEAIAELAEHLVGNVERVLAHEENADALRADEPHDLLDLFLHRLRQVAEEQVSLVEEENELRLVHVADFGQPLEQLADEPQHERGVRARRSHQFICGEDVHDTASVLGALHDVVEVQRGLAEKFVAALLLEREKRALDRAHGRGGHVAESRRVFRGVLRDVLEHRLQVLHVEQQQSLGVGDVKDDIQHTFLRVVQIQQPR